MDDPTRKIKPKQFDIISTENTSTNMKDGKPLHVMIEVYNIVRGDINKVIGEPMYWA